MAVAAKIGMKVISIAISIPVGIVTKKVVERAWVAARPDNPPRKANDAEVQWGDAIAWAALSATGIVVSEMITRRGTAVAFRSITGLEPPPPKPSKDAKKLAKAEDALVDSKKAKAEEKADKAKSKAKNDKIKAKAKARR